MSSGRLLRVENQDQEGIYLFIYFSRDQIEEEAETEGGEEQ